jgi:alpha-L-rhamnosidase
LGIDETKPHLSWILLPRNERQRGVTQTAYQVLVASDQNKLLSGVGDLWDSGKVISDCSSQVTYSGAPLGSGTDCWWKVRVWDNHSKASSWSVPARWSMGLLKPDDWSAQWIGYTYKAKTDPKLPQATYWRKEVKTEKTVARAMLYASALGSYVVHINGRRVGNDYFNPGWTDFRKRVYYHTYDVTAMLRPGHNALAAILSTGWYAGYIWAGPFNYGSTPKLLLQLNVEYVDGTRQTVGTGTDWKVSYGPLLEADIQQGETYDARLEIPNWNLAGFDDSNWEAPDVKQEPVPIKVERDNSLALLCAAPHPPVRRQREIRPVSMSCPTPGTYVFDLGESIAGWAKLKAKGPQGSNIVLRCTGKLNPDGTIYYEYLREARVKDSYVLKGSGEEEVWEPLFTYHGFQYVEVTGYPGVPTLDTITGVVCNSDLERTGSFECSDPRVNQLYRNSVDTIVANFVDLPTGCSDRSERLGWMGQAQLMYSWCYSYDMNAFLDKYMTDIVDAQSFGKSGSYLQVSPIWGDIESPGWSDDGVCVPYALYRFYGNTNIVAKNYESLQKYLAHIERSLTGYLRIGPVYHYDGQKFIGYGDWLAIVENRELHADVLNTLWNGWSVSNMAELAAGIGKHDDAAKYRQLLKNMKSAFNAAYVSSDGKVKHDIQGEYALGLYFNFFPENKIAGAVAHLVDDVANKSHTEARENPSKKPRIIPPGHLTTGFHSSRALLPVLSKYGQNALAYKLLLQDTYPSWLYPVKYGATSCWERWDSWSADQGFQDKRMNSFGMPHLMASVVEWLMSYAAGIQSSGLGGKRIAVKPYPSEGLTWLHTSYKSINGNIAVKWTRMNGGAFTMQVSIPPNTKGTISVPKNGAKSVVVYESGKLVWSKNTLVGKIPGIATAIEDADYVNFQVGSGSYEFTTLALNK